MNLEEYQKAAMRSYKDGSLLEFIGAPLMVTKVTKALLGAIGLAGEVGECTEPVKKWFFHRRFDANHVREKLKEELGDVLWYCALLADAFDLSLDEIAQQNVDKLMKRHPPTGSPWPELFGKKG